MGTRTLTLEQILTAHEQANEQAAAVINADEDILAADLTPLDPPCLFRIQVCSDSAAIFNARITRGANTQTVSFNEAANLTVDALYIFDLLVHDGDTINFQFNAEIDILRVFRVQEITGGVQ